MHLVLTEYVILLGWILALIVTLAGGVAILAWLLNWLTGEINVWKEIRKKNVAMATVVAAAIIAIGLVIGLVGR